MRAALEWLLADGARWLIRPRDDEAAKIVARLGKVMCLEPARRRGRRLDVVVDGRCREAGRVPVAGDRDPVRCVLSPPEDEDMLTIQIMYLSLAVARDAQARGGLLLHGALAERDGEGIILAGPGGVGKSTASRRLPPPWKPLCDDACLVVRDGQDRYRAHPWPTWSEFYGNGPGRTWDVQQAVPLRAVFFLQQSSSDSVEPVNPSQAQAMLMESAGQVSRSMTRRCSDREIRAVHAEQMAAATALAAAVPAHRLRISLTGKFWEAIDEVLSRPSGIRAHGPQAPAAGNRAAAMDVVYTGPSMNPTLWAGDLLSVLPYGRSEPRAGDVVYFLREGQPGVVHRVLRVHDANVTTRGDNNRADDPYTVQRDEIVGRVVAARSANGLRKISGGRWGILKAYVNRIRKPLLVPILRFLQWPYRALAATRILRRLLPNHFRPLLVRFRANRFGEEFKLLLGRREVGRYDPKDNRWRIRRPYRLLVDEHALHRPDQGLRKARPSPGSARGHGRG